MSCQCVSYYLLRCVRVLADWFTSCIGVCYLSKRRYLPPITNPLLLESAVNLSEKIRTGKLKCEDLIKAYIERIKSVNPHINALIDDRFGSALEEAKLIDEKVERQLSGFKTIEEVSIDSQPLLGIPFTVKDSVAIKGLFQTAGLYSRKGFTAEDDSQVVKNLRAAGAIPIGITNVPEFLLWFDSYNKIFGQTNNPYDKSRISGGSSGGEAALIASAASVMGIGTDIGGSIRIPACFCGIYGHKPTPGVVPIGGMFPKIETEMTNFLSFGPLCRYASDLRPALKSAAGEDADKLKLDDKVDFSQLKVYYSVDDCDPLKTPVSVEIAQTIRRAAKLIEEETGVAAEQLDMPEMKHSFWIWLFAMGCHKKARPLAVELTERSGRVNGWRELGKWLIGRSQYRFITSYHVILERIMFDDTVKAGNRANRLLAKGEQLKAKLSEILGSNAVLLYPCQPETALKHNGTLFKPNNCGYTTVFNVLELPVTQVPLGLAKDGLPIGLQVISGPFNDNLTISVAELLERKFGGWIPPIDVVIEK